MKQPVSIPAQRIVVVMPNWLGDAVMATPFLRALKGIYPQGHIAAVARGVVAAMCEELVDETVIVGKGGESKTSKWMRGERFDLGILLPNSFRSAWMLWRGGAKRRLGYARGGRSLLLTDRIDARRKTDAQKAKDEQIRLAISLLRNWEAVASGDLLRVELKKEFTYQLFVECRMRSTGEVVRRREHNLPDMHEKALRGPYQPVPTIDYYLELARYLGAADATRAMEVVISPAEQEEATAALGALGFGSEGFVVLVPGANFGSSKCWMPERFAAVAEALTNPAGPFKARVLLAGSPAEAGICAAIVAGMKTGRERTAILSSLNGGKGVSIGALKSIVGRARMMICNDTGPRHIAAAQGVPTVTLFGPTDPVWAETFFDRERIVRVEVPCGPCQLKQCPIDHRCMKGITPEMVLAAVRELWQQTDAPKPSS